MIDRIVRHTDVLTLEGASYRLRGRGIDNQVARLDPSLWRQVGRRRQRERHADSPSRLTGIPPTMIHTDGRPTERYVCLLSIATRRHVAGKYASGKLKVPTQGRSSGPSHAEDGGLQLFHGLPL